MSTEDEQVLTQRKTEAEPETQPEAEPAAEQPEEEKRWSSGISCW